MTKRNMPVAYCGSPVQKLVDHNTETNLTSSGSNPSKRMGFLFCKVARFEKLYVTVRWTVTVYQFKNWYTTVL